MVAAILEIIRSTENYVLVCCNSNAACDEITERLVDHLDQDKIFRILAKSYDKSSISKKILPISNVKDDNIEFPSFEFLYKFRVVISTLMTAGSLVRGREIDGKFNSSHFSHIFIDEAASVHEPVCLVPIGKLPLLRTKNFSFRRHHCQIFL